MEHKHAPKFTQLDDLSNPERGQRRSWPEIEKGLTEEPLLLTQCLFCYPYIQEDQAYFRRRKQDCCFECAQPGWVYMSQEELEVAEQIDTLIIWIKRNREKGKPTDTLVQTLKRLELERALL